MPFKDLVNNIIASVIYDWLKAMYKYIKNNDIQVSVKNDVIKYDSGPADIELNSMNGIISSKTLNTLIEVSGNASIKISGGASITQRG